MSAPRWVRKGSYVYDGCRACGSCYGVQADRLCSASTCQACGSVVCSSYGLGSGHCPVCVFGLLDGWSGWDRHRCGYNGCGGVAVASAPRVGHACKECLPRVKVRVSRMRTDEAALSRGFGALAQVRESVSVPLSELIAEYLAERPAKFVEVSP